MFHIKKSISMNGKRLSLLESRRLFARNAKQAKKKPVVSFSSRALTNIRSAVTLKNMRNSLLVLGTGVLAYNAYNIYGGDVSLLQRVAGVSAVNSFTPKKKFVLKVEKLEDRLVDYKGSFIGATSGLTLFREYMKMQKLRCDPMRSMGGPFAAEDVDRFAVELRNIRPKYEKLVANEKKKRMAYLDHSLSKELGSNIVSVISQGTIQKKLDKAKMKEREKKTTKEGGESSSIEQDVKRVKIHEEKLKAESELKRTKLQEELHEAQIELDAFLRDTDTLVMNLLLNTPKMIERVKSINNSTAKDRGVTDRVEMLQEAKKLVLAILFDETMVDRLKVAVTKANQQQPRVFVLDFNGDTSASQVGKLKEEITGILEYANAARGDKVVVTVNSGGGTVTGYGYGAAQLARIKAAGFSLTVCVDQVAASGGYLMSAVADEIVASPFALIGSIGVVSTMPNFSERMQREGVQVEDVTAGRYKRTMTPYSKTSSADRYKVQQDVESVLKIFKDYLKLHRPKLNVEQVATGETWHGPQALHRGLVDSLCTSDEYILKQREAGCDVYFVRLERLRSRPTMLDVLSSSSDDEGGGGDSALFTASGGGISTWRELLVAAVVRALFSGAGVPRVDPDAIDATDPTKRMSLLRNGGALWNGGLNPMDFADTRDINRGMHWSQSASNVSNAPYCVNKNPTMYAIAPPSVLSTRMSMSTTEDWK